MNNSCDYCEHYCYDDEAETYYCDVSLDEDDMERYLRGTNNGCNYFKAYDEYKLVEKQN